MRDSQQNEKLLKEVYSRQKKTGTTANEKWSFRGVMEILGSVYKVSSHRRNFVSETPTRTPLGECLLNACTMGESVHCI